MAPEQRRSSPANTEDARRSDRDLWINSVVRLRLKAAGKSKEDPSQDAERTRVLAFWDQMPKAYRTGLAADHRAFAIAQVRRKDVIAHAVAISKQEPQVRGSDEDGWRYDIDAFGDLEAARKKVEDFEMARPALAELVTVIEKIVTTLEGAREEDKLGLAASLAWAREGLEKYRKDVQVVRTNIQRHEEAIWEMERRPFRLDRSWYGAWAVGHGSYASADLWVKGGKDGLIKDVSIFPEDSLCLMGIVPC